VGSQLRRIIHGGLVEPSNLNAVGVWFYSSSTHRYLYLMRNDPKHPYHWGLPGGKVENGETLLDTITRECA
jgi:8-oxo-dGTP pyrophosphatase MutT (NUDIX family)